MCGIVGIAEAVETSLPKKPIVEAMLSMLVHRGPDDQGLHDGGAAVLGARRLKVIDLLDGHQPMSNEDGTLWVAFNGEIYNHAALRATLAGRGHVFASRCDTEVIVHAWEEWGEQSIERFEGMFGVAVWDARTGTLVLARDRLGIKPLYYAWDGRRLLFASEIKAILASGLVSAAVDYQSVYDAIGYEFVPAPATMFRGVLKLPAGHLLRLHRGTLQTARYWDVSFAQSGCSRTAALQGIRTLLEEAVVKRLNADVPLGVFLSGGVDSTAILALATRASSRPVRTFTLGYADATFSEWADARRVARHFGAEHHEIMIDPITPEQIERVVWHFDEPMTEFSGPALFLLCEQARSDVTVCLSGEGNDELFIGYDRFVASKLDATVYRRLPWAVRRGLIEPLVRALPDQRQKKGVINKVKRFVEGAALPRHGGHLRWQHFSTAEDDRRLFASGFLTALRRDRFEAVLHCRNAAGAVDRLASESYVDLRFTMPESVLMKVDKMSMAHGLELRVPFLDHKLVKFVAALPSDWKFPALRTKALYREAMRGIVPDFVLARGKQGYSIPIKNWLRGNLRDYLASTLNESPFIRECFNLPYINHLIDEHQRCAQNHSHRLWALLNIALWHRRFIEQPLALVVERSPAT